MVSGPRRDVDVETAADLTQLPQQRAAPAEAGQRPRGPAAAGVSEQSATPRFAAVRWRTSLRWVLAAVAALTLAAAGTQIVLNTGQQPAAGPAAGPDAAAPAGTDGGAIAALDGLSGPPTLFGRVVSVLDPATAVVEVQQRPITVRVIGVDVTGTPACARADATAFARRTLTGQTVTLVPDPTLPTAAGGDPGSWPAYLVLGTQQSYTDLALGAGWVSAGEGRYRAGFLERERQARDNDVGMWGPPCNRPPPS